ASVATPLRKSRAYTVRTTGMPCSRRSSSTSRGNEEIGESTTWTSPTGSLALAAHCSRAGSAGAAAGGGSCAWGGGATGARSAAAGATSTSSTSPDRSGWRTVGRANGRGGAHLGHRERRDRTGRAWRTARGCVRDRAAQGVALDAHRVELRGELRPLRAGLLGDRLGRHLRALADLVRRAERGGEGILHLGVEFLVDRD